MSSNHSRLCRDGIFGSLQIKSQKVLDKDTNLTVNDAKVRGNAKVKEDLTISGDLVVQGCISQLGQDYDVVIIGGGTAGAVAAKLITDTPGISVLVLEQGENQNDNPLVIEPFTFDAEYGSINLFNAAANPRAGDNIQVAQASDTWPLTHGQGVFKGGYGWGGASAHNYIYAIRTSTGHDDTIASLVGDAAWDGAAMDSIYKELESFDGGMALPTPAATRGNVGPVSVLLSQPVSANNMADDMLNAIRTQSPPDIGITKYLDINSGDERLLANVSNQFLNSDLTRAFAGRAFLGNTIVDQTTGEGVSGRTLKVVSDALVGKILFDDTKKACSVVAAVNGKTIYYGVKSKVIVCAGTLRTPGILERSGVGDASILGNIGIPVVYDNPAVGEELQTHCGPQIQYYVDGGSYVNQQHTALLKLLSGPTPNGYDRHFQVLNSAGNGIPGLNANKALLSCVGHPLDGANAYACPNWNLQPTSRGSAHIVDPQPGSNPEIFHNLNSTAEDKAATREVVRLWKRVTEDINANVPGLGMVLTVPPLTGNAAIDFDNDAEVDYWIASTLSVTDHYSGTCRMGSVASGNVVNSSLHVYGVSGVMCADNSIWPYIPDCNTAFPAMAVGKRAADIVLAELAP